VHSDFPNTDLYKVFSNKIKRVQACIGARVMKRQVCSGVSGTCCSVQAFYFNIFRFFCTFVYFKTSGCVYTNNTVFTLETSLKDQKFLHSCLFNSALLLQGAGGGGPQPGTPKIKILKFPHFFKHDDINRFRPFATSAGLIH
jgi:hypothetical protein